MIGRILRPFVLEPPIPYTHHVSRTDVATLAGDICRTYRLDGLPLDSASVVDLASRKARLARLMRDIGGPRTALWWHMVRRRRPIGERPVPRIGNEWCRGHVQRYQRAMQDEMAYSVEHYFSTVRRSAGSSFSRAIERTARGGPAATIAAYRADLAEINAIGHAIEEAFAAHEPRALGVTDEGHSEVLAFYDYLVSAHAHDAPVALDETLNASRVGTARVEPGDATLRITPAGGGARRYARVLGVDAYPDVSVPDLLAGLSFSEVDIVVTQSFATRSKEGARVRTKREQKKAESSGESTDEEVGDFDGMLAELRSSRSSIGDHHATVAIHAESVDAARRGADRVSSTLSGAGFRARIERRALDSAWYAQLPGGFGARARIRTITTANAASFMQAHAFSRGALERTPWGEPVTTLPTVGGTAYRFAWHGAAGESSGEVSASTRMTGKTGSGKSALLAHLLASSARVDRAPRVGEPDGRAFRSAIFDYRRGLRPFVLATGGEYAGFEDGRPSGWMPLRHYPDTSGGRARTARLVSLLGCDAEHPALGAEDERRIERAVAATMVMEPSARRLSGVLQNLPGGGTGSALARRLARWCADDGTGRRGAYWWVFDGGGPDRLDVDRTMFFGIDGDALLSDPVVRTPATWYLIDRVRELIDGTRAVVLAMDEAPQYLDDPVFEQFAGKEQAVIRKDGGLCVFAGQQPEQFLESAVGPVLARQCATEIYLPDPGARADDYCGQFGLTEAEFDALSALEEGSRAFAIKQSQRGSGGARSMIVARLDLGGMPEDLSVLSGTHRANRLLDEARERTGSDKPRVWLPEYHRLMRGGEAVERVDRVASATIHKLSEAG